MRINEVKCEQFAGLMDRSVRFSPGLNLLIGPNESGKSSLVELLYQLFFHDHVIDRRRDKGFIDLYFPKTAGTYQADTIDGTVYFEGTDGTYRLSKEWSGKDGTVRLTLPGGLTLRDPETISGILKEQLRQGKGVYDELVFASQKRSGTALQGLFPEGSSETDAEIASLLTRAVMESGGIDMDRLSRRIQEEVDRYEKRWDSSADLPEGGRSRGLRNPWKTRGLVLDAYYELAEVENQQEDVLKAELRVEEVRKERLYAEQELKLLREKRERFSSVRGLALERQNTEKLLQASARELSVMDEALKLWPGEEQEFNAAERLKEALGRAERMELYRAVSKDQKTLENLKKELAALGTVERKEVTEAERLQRELLKKESLLSGLRLTAEIRKYQACEVHRTVFRTGEESVLPEGSIDITEAVEITVPGVIGIRLAPKGMDPDQVREELTALKAAYYEILNKYRVESPEELREKQERISALSRDAAHYEDILRERLTGVDFEKLQEEAASGSEDVRSSQEIRQEITLLAGRKTLDSFIGERSGQLTAHRSRYGSIEKLRTLCQEKDAECRSLRVRLSEGASLPEEFREIRDPEAYDRELKEEISSAEERLEELRAQQAGAERELGDRSYEEYTEEYQKKRAEFEERKAMLAHWRHIRAVFQELQGTLLSNPMTDVEEAFRENLRVLSGGTLVLNTLSEELKTQLQSHNRPMTYATLSEGTKETIALAFRLAVLSHLYPEGGALAVFDDPFTDMDPVRTERACRLLQAFAKKNQVIFVSCDEKYEAMLPGNVTHVSF